MFCLTNWIALASSVNMWHFIISKRFQVWLAKGVFTKAWTQLITMYAEQKMTESRDWFKDIFIDTTMIKNVNGIDGLGKNPTDRGRLATKMSVIVDNAMMPLCCEFFPANQVDCTTAIQTINNIQCSIKPDKRYSNIVIADKGYISKTIVQALKAKNMRLLTPTKKNSKQSISLSNDDRNRLKRRHKVENFFCRLDKFKRIHCRVDKSLAAFKAFTLLGMSLVVLGNQKLYSFEEHYYIDIG